MEHWTVTSRKTHDSLSGNSADKVINLFNNIWDKYPDDIPEDIEKQIINLDDSHSSDVQAFVEKYFWDNETFDYSNEDHRYAFNNVEQGDTLMAFVESLSKIVNIEL